MEQHAKIFGGGLGRSVDVLGKWDHRFVDPCCGLTRCRGESGAKGRGGGDECEGFNADGDGGFEEVECAGDVGGDESRFGVGSEVWFVEGRGVDYVL